MPISITAAWCPDSSRESIIENARSQFGPRYAKELNRRLMELDDLSGWIVLDFGTPALAEHIYASNFE